MVDLCLDRTDAGSVATILLGDTIALRVGEADRQRWVIEAVDGVVLVSTGAVASDDEVAGQRVLRFLATAIGRTTLRLLLLGEDGVVADSVALAVEVNAAPPASGRHLFRKRR